ncbi:hypothetical protein ACKUSY_09430 [Myroides odoratus]
MNKLAKGLPSIDGIGNGKFGEWQDAEFVMQNELQAIHSARNLAKYFAEFIRQSLKILKKKQFVLFFDDIDVDSSKGYAVLETIRKYFISDHLISILSGDLKLYDALVRDKKWNNFGTKLITFECSKEFQTENRRQINMNHYNDIVTDLTSQYLIKIMQPKYRIHLSTLYDYYIDKSLKINIRTKKDQDIHVEHSRNEADLKEILTRFFKIYGIKSVLQSNVFIEFLLRQPLRSIIHFLQYSNYNSSGTDFVNIFLSDMYEKHVDVNALQNSIRYFIPNVLQTLIQEQKLRESYQLIPSTLDNSFNATLFCSSLLFSNHIKQGNKYLIFEYFYKIAYLRNFITKEEDYQILNTSLKTSGIMTDNVLRDSCNQLQSSLYGYLDDNKKNNECGVIPLYSLYKISKPAKKEAYYRIDYVFDSISKDNDFKEFRRAIGFIPFYIGTSSKRNSGVMFYSIISLLATIGEICKRFEEKSVSKDNFYTVLSELSQIRYYSITENNIRNSKENKSDNSDQFNESEDENNDHEEETIHEIDTDIYFWFSERLSSWIENKNMNVVSPYLLGKIFTRFYYSLQVIGNDKNLTLGQTFNLQILAFFNAIILEEAREESLNQINFNYNNIVSSERIFIDNLKKVINSREKDRLALSKWMLSCPLLIIYLEKEIVSLISNFITPDTHADSLNYYDYFEVYSLLDQVFIERTKQIIKTKKTFEEIYQDIKNSISPNFLTNYEKDSYRKPTIDKFFREFEELVSRGSFEGTDKDLIKYCVTRYKKDNEL